MASFSESGATVLSQSWMPGRPRRMLVTEKNNPSRGTARTDTARDAGFVSPSSSLDKPIDNGYLLANR
jgi:hypothetical protein